MEAVIPDEQLKERDRRKGKEKFDIRYFKYEKNDYYYICPNGKVLSCRGTVKLNWNEGTKYQCKPSDCKGCPYIDKCLHTKKKGNKY